jgi:hypothetical protein
MHIPATPWHPHNDRVFEVKKPTEFEAWAYTVRDMLTELTQGNLRLMIGYWADALNVLPPDVRKVIITAMAQGLGLQINTVEDTPDTIEVKLVQRYDPLVGDKKTESGLVVPQKPDSALILPGDSRYNVKETP